MTDPRLADFARRMEWRARSASKRIRRASDRSRVVNLLDQIHVDAYAGSMHLSQLATVSVPEPRLITVQVWDKALVKTSTRRSATPALVLTRSRRRASFVSDSRIDAGATQRPCEGRGRYAERRGWPCATFAATAWTC